MDNTIQTNSNSDEHIYITTSDTFTPFPDSILRETVHKYLDSFLTEREDKDMAKLQYTDVWGNPWSIDDNMVKKIAITYDFHRESEHTFRSRVKFIADIFDADIEFRADTSSWRFSLTAYLRFARIFGESEEKYNNRVYLAEKALNTHWDKPLPPGRCQKSSGRYPWRGWGADFDIYQGINHKTEKLQTIVKWNDGETTTVVCNKYELPLIYPVAYAYCIRKFGSNSAFKKKVKTRRIGDYIYGTLHIEGRHYTASVPVRSKKIDIYDEMAVVFATDIYGGILLFEDMCLGNFHESKEDDA